MTTMLTRQERRLADIPRGGAVLAGGLRAVARHLGMAERKVYAMAREGRYPFNLFCVRVGNLWIIPLDAWNRFLRGELQPENESAAPDDTR